MAMELTHVRFAKQLKERLEICDENAYYAGAIYPDSRYITHIERTRTHGEFCPQDIFASGLTDFEKGWATHLVYDRLAGPVFWKLSPWPDEEVHQGNRVWQFCSAAKLVEDMQSYQILEGRVEMISSLKFSEFPNQENPELLRRYADIQRELYLCRPTLDSYRRFWESLTDNVSVIQGVMGMVQDILENHAQQDAIRDVYQRVMDSVSKEMSQDR